MNEQSLFAQVLDISDPEGRAAFLDVECGADAELRQRLERLLSRHQGAGGFLERSPGLPDETMPFFPPELAEAPGTRIGPYQLLEVIGEGGMGTVYMAEQSAPLRRMVALKIIKPGMDSKQVVARFEAERQALALMDHPHIARVFDGGTTEFGRPYFVMELVRGLPVTEYCDQAKMTIRERLGLFVHVCRAVQHAHQKGVIHRDIKPSNVLVTVIDGQPVPKVIDFGIAKATGSALTDRTLFTGFNQFVGTPLYMSPEQAELSGVDVDTRSDVYSLGVLLYELMTGTTPFNRETFRKAGMDEIRRIIREEEPPRPSHRISTLVALQSSTISERRNLDPRRLGQLMRSELDWVVMRALEKDRNRRYESASAFADDVERYLTDAPVQAAPPSTVYRLRKFTRRNKGQVIAASLVFASLVSGAVIGTWQAVRATQAEGLAHERLHQVTAEKLRADEEATIAKAVNDFLQNDLLAEAAPEKNARNKKVTVEEVLGRAAIRMAGKFEKQPLIHAAIRKTIGETYLALGDYPSAQPHLERSLEIRSRLLGDEDVNTLDAMNSLAELYRAQSEYAKAESLNTKALEVRLRIQGEEHPSTVTSMNNLALAYYDQDQLLKAEPLFEKALKICRRTWGDEHRDTLESMNNLAGIYHALGKHDEAESLHVQSLHLQPRVLGDDHPVTLTSMNNLASLYLDKGEFAKAEPLFVKSLEVRRRVLGKEHPDTLTSMNNLAKLHHAKGEFAKAASLYVVTLETQRSVLKKDHPNTITTMNNLAMTLKAMGDLASQHRQQGEFAKAEPLYVGILESRRRALGNEHSLTISSVILLYMLYAQQGEFAKAEPLHREQVAWARNIHGDSSPQGQMALRGLGVNLLEQKQYLEAEKVLRQTLATFKNPEDNSQTASLKSLLGGALLGQKKHAEAEPLLLRGYEGMKQREKTIPPAGMARLSEAADRLVELYTVTNKPDEVKKWQAERAKYPAKYFLPPRPDR